MWIRFRRKLLFFSFSLTFGALCTYRFYHSAVLNSQLENQRFADSLTSGSRGHGISNKDIHVVIGYYQGNNLPWVQSDNLTDEILNSNMYSPDPEAGRDGEGVLIQSFESPKMRKLFQINRFNLMASDRIPLNRTLPDVRRKECRVKKYPPLSADTSVIIIFHNEAFSTLMRTIHSVINRSPRHLLKEIILVDDASQRRFLGGDLEAEVKSLSVPVQILRSVERVGLVKARLLGAKVAQGKILTFLDSHCECTEGWLEPLISRISEDHRAIVSPVIDIINDETFQYIRSFELHSGGFNWELHFRWFSLPPEVIEQRQGDPTIPFQTPVMAGGLFSIDRAFFYELGAYDEEMKIWGGENLEISFRGWLCGAILEISPCSHVGHLFRKSSPYSFPGGVGDVLNSNLARVALVWMDEWKDFYFKLHPEVAKLAKNQTIASRLSHRKRLKCKPFSWFLNKIWPTNFFPGKNRTLGRVRNSKSLKCLQSPKSKTFGQPYGIASLSECIIEMYAPQLFVMTPEGFIMTDDSVCLDPPEFKGTNTDVRIMACNNLPRQKWEFNKSGQIIHLLSEKCLDLPLIDPNGPLTLRKCDIESKSQKWVIEDIDWK